MLKLSDLAGRGDFHAGPLRISPARRLIEGPIGHANLEPIVMKVFLLLLDASGRVVTRDELFGYAWGGVFVGDDSLNRAIARVRKIAADTAPGLFEIETIPRTGYRLTGEILEALNASVVSVEVDARPSGISRRIVIGAGTGVAAILGVGVWSFGRLGRNAGFETLIDRGNDALRTETGNLQAERLFEQATVMRPESARAWGLLAYSRAILTDSAPPGHSADMADNAQFVARKALAIDRQEPNALTALALMEEWIDGWQPFDNRLRHVLTIDPRNSFALSALVALTQAAGLTSESWGLNERLLRLNPMSPVPVYRKAFKLWIMGRVAESFKVIDRAIELWPSHPGVWTARLIIFAFTNRSQAALRMLNDNPKMMGNPAATAMWRASLNALSERSPTAIAAATKVILEVAKQAPGLAAQGVMILGALGEVDAAFNVANGFLLSRGDILVSAAVASKQGTLNKRGWRWTQWLFSPPASSLRADHRFEPLCDAIGLAEYWRARRVRPDFEGASA